MTHDGGHERGRNLIEGSGGFKVEIARIVDRDQTLEEFFPIIQTGIGCEVEIVKAVVIVDVERLHAVAERFHTGFAVETENEQMSDIKTESEAFFFGNAVETVDVISSLVHVGADGGIDLFGLPILTEHIFQTAKNVVCLECGNEGAVKVEVQLDFILLSELGEAVASVEARVDDDFGNTEESAELNGFDHIVAQEIGRAHV